MVVERTRTHCKRTLEDTLNMLACLMLHTVREKKIERRPGQLLRYVFCFLFEMKKYIFMGRHINTVIAYRSLKKAIYHTKIHLHIYIRIYPSIERKLNRPTDLK
jgi:hypothetical protein